MMSLSDTCCTARHASTQLPATASAHACRGAASGASRPRGLRLFVEVAEDLGGGWGASGTSRDDRSRFWEPGRLKTAMMRTRATDRASVQQHRKRHRQGHRKFHGEHTASELTASATATAPQ